MYSQNQEEKVIREYFGEYVGTFIDIGSNDGVTLSNTKALADVGWSGVFVEPSPLAYLKLKDNYRLHGQRPKEMHHRTFEGLYFYNVAIGTHNGRMKFYESGTHLNKGDVGLLSTGNAEEMKRWPGEKFEEREVICYRWKTFLNRLKIKKFDFISIDAEGLDFQILEQIDLKDTKLVCIEWNSNADLKAKYDAYMNDFKVIYTSAENLLYAR